MQLGNSQSAQYHEQACKLIPGGVNSPVRACKAVGKSPIFFEKGEGAYLHDVDGKRYIDTVCSWGALMLGHAPEKVVEAISAAATRGTSYGACHPLEIEMARLIQGMFPSMELTRMVNSGTEATMSAVRLARGYTGRDKIIKFEGCYHGHADSFLISAGSGVLTLGIPGSPGVTAATASGTLVARFNDLESVVKILEDHRGEVAALILEPVMANAGVILPAKGFLEGLRELTRAHGVVLIFDEVITGLRVGPGGAQALYGIEPDLTCLGKIIGGGLPVGAFGGKKEIMEYLAPIGPVYQAGTLSGNPLVMAAGIAMLKEVSVPGFYEQMEQKAEMLEKGIIRAIQRGRIKACFNRGGSMFTLFFKEGAVTYYQDAMQSDTMQYAQYYKHMLEHGIYVAPSQFEAGFLSSRHGEGEVEEILSAMEQWFNHKS